MEIGVGRRWFSCRQRCLMLTSSSSQSVFPFLLLVLLPLFFLLSLLFLVEKRRAEDTFSPDYSSQFPKSISRTVRSSRQSVPFSSISVAAVLNRAFSSPILRIRARSSTPCSASFFFPSALSPSLQTLLLLPQQTNRFCTSNFILSSFAFASAARSSLHRFRGPTPHLCNPSRTFHSFQFLS